MDDLVVMVTDADVRAARDAIRRAQLDRAEPERQALLRRDLEQLYRLQARQMIEEFRQREPR
ncbi:hypothetical protein [Actinotalea sp. Marseille-Q4924]|uniref:hypothetical protein n=1 Tax=Actinotalea sp. Marseille-Q4924 TaxID=2866571 RepID=UPI001CE3F801|nr:hypothetical protein [Actinotalea sp. Marseille-Q4924]